MKINKFILTIATAVLMTACSLEEEPPFLSKDNIFENLTNARNGLKGVYRGLADWGNYSYSAHVLYEGFSGHFTYRHYNQGVNYVYNQELFALKPAPNTTEVEAVWRTHYTTISRANDIISALSPIENPANDNDKGMNDVLGQAYFIRAFEYFDLVRLWGEVPLRLEPMNTENIHKPKSPVKDIYAQIMADIDIAKKLMLPAGEQLEGFAAKEAANMLLAKVYMTLATADPELQEKTPEEYWKLAYDEAIQVYGKYSLVSDYKLLWDETTGSNTSESIFEIQYNEVSGSGMPRLYTPRGATIGNNTWGRIYVNAEAYDDHADTYPGDPRIKATFIGEYTNVVTNTVKRSYPAVSRTSFYTGYPYAYKYWAKNVNMVGITNNQNFIIYRYADLLLMLAEISNELQNGEQMKYVEEVLARVELSPQAEYYGGQDSFREAIMKEYRYELLGELQSVFNDRRRGYEWFKSHVIDVHNNYDKWDETIDILLSDDPEYVMYLPIPSSEINTNQEINN
ncbi:MAG: RagB/SusD family nutrient uptake outer membrane protein [Chlorobi bacterium]|nr:RagB/SusD family nutrient uptake outer membrane protein [Chlorobiota bacterium]